MPYTYWLPDAPDREGWWWVKRTGGGDAKVVFLSEQDLKDKKWANDGIKREWAGSIMNPLPYPADEKIYDVKDKPIRFGKHKGSLIRDLDTEYIEKMIHTRFCKADPPLYKAMSAEYERRKGGSEGHAAQPAEEPPQGNGEKAPQDDCPF